MLSIAALGFITAIGISTLSLSSLELTWLRPGAPAWWLATLVITGAWYALHKGYLRCVVPVFKSIGLRISRILPMAFVVISIVFGVNELAMAQDEKKRTLLDTLKAVNEGLKEVTDAGNEVRGALENGMVPVLDSVQHSIYRPPFYAKKGIVTVYTGPLCAPCDEAVAHLVDARIAHKVLDVTTSTRGKREYKKLDGHGVPILLFIGRRMDGFTSSDFECAKVTPKGQEADCEFEELSAPDETVNDEDKET